MEKSVPYVRLPDAINEIGQSLFADRWEPILTREEMSLLNRHSQAAKVVSAIRASAGARDHEAEKAVAVTPALRLAQARELRNADRHQAAFRSALEALQLGVLIAEIRSEDGVDIVVPQRFWTSLTKLDDLKLGFVSFKVPTAYSTRDVAGWVRITQESLEEFLVRQRPASDVPSATPTAPKRAPSSPPPLTQRVIGQLVAQWKQSSHPTLRSLEQLAAPYRGNRQALREAGRTVLKSPRRGRPRKFARK